MTLIPRKRCTKCGATFEGPEVEQLHSCDVCGNGYLTEMKPIDTEAKQGAHLPRGGGGGTITHTRDGF